MHCAWWIFHFSFFEDETTTNANNQTSRNNIADNSRISRKSFASEILKAIAGLDRQAFEYIMKSETIFGDLKKLSEK